ncbi:MAG: SCP-2 sterol transfer family protein [Promethearchaeota archaeon]|nr:MAG: SCP-2 sterol transfer family protein [Candidatus Lokiarchaeota archaeon]
MIHLMSIICQNCGKKIETISLECGYSVNVDEKTNKWGCNTKNCGFLTFDNFLCRSCCEKSLKPKIFN